MIDVALKVRNSVRIGVLGLAMLGLTACGGDMDDLDQYINEVKSRPGGRIEPLPEITLYEAFAYVADAENVRSPFVPDRPQVSTSGPNILSPDDDRSREFLEGFPLDTLSMVGTLYIGETMYGLVQTSDGLIHRVVPGNYLGQNDGRINEIDESGIELIEIISDGIGGYIERDAAISLSD